MTFDLWPLTSGGGPHVSVLASTMGSTIIRYSIEVPKAAKIYTDANRAHSAGMSIITMYTYVHVHVYIVCLFVNVILYMYIYVHVHVHVHTIMHV